MHKIFQEFRPLFSLKQAAMALCCSCSGEEEDSFLLEFKISGRQLPMDLDSTTIN
jgi:hypothetical protein